MSFFPRPHPPARPFARSHHSGFTLVELLTVIAIIGVLAGILVPVIGSVRTSAKQSVSVSNMRQVGVAMLAFVSDNRGHFPLSTHSHDNKDSWINTLLPYVGDNNEVRTCPLDPRKDLLIERRLSSYTLNEWLLPVDNGDGYVSDWRYNRLNLIPNPGKTFVVFMGCEHKTSPSISHDHTHGTGWNNWLQVIADIDPDRFRKSTRSPDRTEGSSPYAFADGHVSVIPAATLQAALANANFSKPGNW
jgi:prepilin-type N-terminal cleavage/methylation domain-containing protein/prepilin-type processing-associated H-X9-DG protein